MKPTVSNDEARKLIADELGEAQRRVRNFTSGVIHSALRGGRPDSASVENAKQALAKRDVLREALQDFDAYIQGEQP